MGLEAHYQALPADSSILDVARREQGVGEWLSQITPMFQNPRFEFIARGGAPDPGQHRLWQLVVEDLRARPELGALNVDLDRSWDSLHFVLSAHRREASGSEDDTLADVAVRGEELIADHVRAGQGVPVRYTRPETVARIAHMLRGLEFASLRQHFVPDEMHEHAVYKSPHPEEDEEAWRSLQARFDGFRDFYRAAAEHGDGVLVILD